MLPIRIGIDKFYQFKYRGKGVRGIEVIFHGLLKFCHKSLCLAFQFFLRAALLSLSPVLHQEIQILYRRDNPVIAVLCRLHQLRTEIQRASVMGGKHKEPQYLQIIFLGNIPHRKEISGGL